MAAITYGSAPSSRNGCGPALHLSACKDSPGGTRRAPVNRRHWRWRHSRTRERARALGQRRGGSAAGCARNWRARHRGDGGDDGAAPARVGAIESATQSESHTPEYSVVRDSQSRLESARLRKLPTALLLRRPRLTCVNITQPDRTKEATYTQRNKQSVNVQNWEGIRGHVTRGSGGPRAWRCRLAAAAPAPARRARARERPSPPVPPRDGCAHRCPQRPRYPVLPPAVRSNRLCYPNGRR